MSTTKELKAKVKLEITDAERKLKKLSSLIAGIDKSLNKRTNKNGLETSISKARIQQEKLKQSMLKTQLAEAKVTEQKHKTALAAQKVKDATDKSKDSANKLLATVKKVAAAYLGIQTLKLGVETADKITGAENRLNNLEGATPETTAEAMDKIYAAAQRARTSYTGMLSDVSKTMTLAGDSFQGNIDNAIRFQEIMAKSYVVGGASATEASTSMYQLVQALGSGTLAGDELRSVREGAPLAYKAIEEFAQGVLKTDESLKDLASQGVITSDIVVAAIMASEDKINESFENTSVTFAQAWEKIKNTATRSFQPVLQKLTDILNSDAVTKIIDSFAYILYALATIVGAMVNILGGFFTWCADNWNWLKYLVIGALVAIAAYIAYLTAVTIVNAVRQIIAWIAVHWQLVLILLIIALAVAAILWLANTTTKGCEFMVAALLVVAMAIILIGIITGSVAMIIVGIVIALVAIFLMFAEEIVGAVYWVGAVCYNVGMGVANFFIACWNWVRDAGYNAFAGVANFAIALKDAIVAIAQNIGAAFQNAWIWAKNTFWEFLASVMDGVSKFEPIINGIAELVGGDGIDFGSISSNLRSKKEEYVEFVSVGDAWNSGMNTFQYRDLGDAWSSGINTFEYKDLSDAYDKGAQVGTNIQNKVGEWGSAIQGALDMDNIAGKTGLPNVSDPALALGDSYDPSGANADIQDGLDKLNGTTEDISDKMDISDDDLEYLRKIAEMEWRKEFTTAEIKIDMTNNNNWSGDRDMDGFVSYLGDVLREEMVSVSEGVHY